MRGKMIDGVLNVYFCWFILDVVLNDVIRMILGFDGFMYEEVKILIEIIVFVFIFFVDFGV